MPIWVLTMAIAGGAAWFSFAVSTAWVVALWMSFLGVVSVAPGVAEKFTGTTGWLFALLVLAGGALGALLFPEQVQTGFLGGAGLMMGSAMGVKSTVFRWPAAVAGLVWAAIMGGLWVASQIPMWPALFGLAGLPVGIFLGSTFHAVAGIDDGTDVSDPEELLALARDAMEVFDLPRARKLLERAAMLAPEDREITEARYAAWKFDPTADEFHAVASELLEFRDVEFATRYYRDYLAVTQVRPQLRPDLHLELARRFAGAGNPDDSARIVNLYLQRDPETPRLAESLFAVCEAYASENNRSKAVRYAETLVALFPHSEQTPKALEMLELLQHDAVGSSKQTAKRKIQKPEP